MIRDLNGMDVDRGSVAEDIRLWERLQEGDRNAVSELFRKYYRPLLNYGMKLIPNQELVKDSIQELFYSLWDQHSNLSDVEYIRSYLYTSLRRKVFRHAEIKKNRYDRDEAYSKENSHNITSHEQLMILNDLELKKKEQLKRALKVLSDREKEAIFLKFYSGLSNVEIAEIMEVNRQSVYNYIYRAIQSLKSYLKV